MLRFKGDSILYPLFLYPILVPVVLFVLGLERNTGAVLVMFLVVAVAMYPTVLLCVKLRPADEAQVGALQEELDEG
jgi:hypothetical protein